MRLCDLGTLVVQVGDQEHAVEGARGPAILALLVINANRRVSTEALMGAAWGDHITAGAPSTLETHIWRIRRLLEPDRGRRPPAVLINESGGYRLVSDVDSIDSTKFARLAVDVRDLLAAGRPGEATESADAALALWRGMPFTPFTDEEWATTAAAKLMETRAQIQERRVDALLELGDNDQVLTDTEDMLAESPFREHIWAQRMLAEYRGGRGEAALATYQRGRHLLLDELGADPGPALQELHARMLQHDPALASAPAPTAEPGPVQPKDLHLPPRLTPLIGRGDEVSELAQLLSTAALITLVGAAGAGKTRLAIDVAAEAAHQFPDGVWFFDLTSVTEPAQVPDLMVSILGLTPPIIGSPLDGLVSYARARRMLLVIDNCEHVLETAAEVTEALLDIGSRCRILSTSREPLDVMGETIWAVEPLAVNSSPAAGDDHSAPDTVPPAVELFLQRLQAAVPTMTIDATVRRLTLEICIAVDGLPLAIELAAARARAVTLSDIADQVISDPSVLSRVGRARPDHRTTLRSAIDWSYRLLAPDERTAHRRLSVLPGSFLRAAAAAVAPDLDIDHVLAQLVNRSLLGSVQPATGARRPRYQQLATVRGHARNALNMAGETSAAETLRNEWARSLLNARPRWGHPDEAAWYDTVDESLPVLRVALTQLLREHQDPSAARLPTSLLSYGHHRSQLTETESWLQAAADVPNVPEDDKRAIHLGLAMVFSARGRLDLARPHLDEALSGAGDAAGKMPVETVELFVMAAQWLWPRGEVEVARKISAIVDTSAAAADDPALTALAGSLRSLTNLPTNDLTAAAANAEFAWAQAVSVGNGAARWIAGVARTIIAMSAGEPAEGLIWGDRVGAELVKLGPGGLGPNLEHKANLTEISGNHLGAVRLYAASRTQSHRFGLSWPLRPITTTLLQTAQAEVEQDAYRRAWAEGEHSDPAELIGASAPHSPGGAAPFIWRQT